MNNHANTKGNITVLDSVMGSGKSTYIINLINDNPDENYVIVVPTKSEQSRYAISIEREVFIPSLEDGDDRLLTSFNYAVKDGKTIVTTHRLLECWDDVSVKLLKNQNYTLILDEVIDVVLPASIKKSDFDMLRVSNYIEVKQVEGKDGLETIRATEGTDYDGVLHRFWNMTKNGNVYRTDDTFVTWLAGPEKIKAFDDVYILTYAFEGQQLKYWLDIHGLTYSIHSVSDGQLIPYQGLSGFKFRHLIEIVEDKKLTKAYYRHSSLSSSWFEKAIPEQIKTLSNSLRSFFRSTTCTDSEFNLVTCFKGDESKLLRGPFKFVSGDRRLSDIKKMTPDERANDYCHLPFNARATNLYKHKKAIAYPVNVFPNPSVVRLFARHIDGFSESTFSDTYALSTMIQFIYRSAIRDGNKITVYIPSKRMRDLLKDWLSL